MIFHKNKPSLLMNTFSDQEYELLHIYQKTITKTKFPEKLSLFPNLNLPLQPFEV